MEQVMVMVRTSGMGMSELARATSTHAFCSTNGLHLK